MSKTTIRKRIAVTATSALLAGVLSVVVAPASQAHNAVGAGTNTAMNLGTIAGLGTSSATTSFTSGSLFTAVIANNTASATSAVAAASGAGCGGAITGGTSKGLLFKDSSSGVAQTATVLQGATLALYSCTATAVAFSASAGSIVASGGNADQTTWTYSSNNRSVWSGAITSATQVGALWTAPTAVGTYTVSLYQGFYTPSNGTPIISSASIGVLPPNLAGNMVVTVVAATAGGTYNAGESNCKAVKGSTTTPTNSIDDTGANANGLDWSIDFALRDAYAAVLPQTSAMVATATNGALLAFGVAGTTPVAGTTSTIVQSDGGSNDTVRVSQGTAGAALTTTVTITLNGTVVCTKTVSFAGAPTALTIASIGVQKIGTGTGNSLWLSAAETQAGTFYVVTTDSVGNRVAVPSTVGTFAAVSGTTGNTVTALTFPRVASGTSSTSVTSATVGSHTCAATAGTQKGVKVQLTLANGTIITSAPFDLSCADDAAVASASFDKAKYTSGDIATLTISFKDSKGFDANNVTGIGAHTIAVPGMTLVSTTGAATAVLKAGSKLEYTYTVGQTAGKFSSVVDHTGGSALLTQFSKVQNPSYEITTGGDTTSMAQVLQSIVALIASINKQISALQKLILKR
jgi:hypothetical protein